MNQEQQTFSELLAFIHELELQEAELTKDCEKNKDILKEIMEKIKKQSEENGKMVEKIEELRKRTLEEAKKQIEIIEESTEVIKKYQVPKVKEPSKKIFALKYTQELPIIDKIPDMRDYLTSIQEKSKTIETELEKEVKEVEIKHNMYELRLKQLLQSRAAPETLMKRL